MRFADQKLLMAFCEAPFCRVPHSILVPRLHVLDIPACLSFCYNVTSSLVTFLKPCIQFCLKQPKSCLDLCEAPFVSVHCWVRSEECLQILWLQNWTVCNAFCNIHQCTYCQGQLSWLLIMEALVYRHIQSCYNRTHTIMLHRHIQSC